MQVLGQIPNQVESYKLIIHEKCRSIILYKLSETQVIEHPDDKHCIFWLKCPQCQETFEVK